MAYNGEEMSVECGFCLQKDADMDNPKQLPCSHIHCLPCLTAQFKAMKVVRCPLADCRQVFDIKLENLPKSEREFLVDWCDVCTKKGLKKAATTYCAQCSKKYCDNHIEWHNDMFDDHPKITMEMYRAQAQQLEIKTCDEHRDLPYVRGCKQCHSIFCVECVYGLKACTDGAPHTLLPLEELVDELNKEIFNLTAILIDKEGKLADLFKQTSIVVADYATETGDLVAMLHVTRDEQLEAVRTTYAQLEKRLLEERAKSEALLRIFLDNTVSESWSTANKTTLRIRNKQLTSHKVDIVKDHDATKEMMQELISEDLPSLLLPNVQQLKSKVTSRDIELELTSKEINITSEHTQSHVLPPKSLTLLKSVPTTSHIRSVCHYDGETYVGLFNETLSKIDRNGVVSPQFIRLGGFGDSVIVYRDRIYALSVGQRAVIIVYDLTGKIIMSWTHDDSASFNKIAIVKNLVIAPDRDNRQLIAYSLDGRKVRTIPCPMIRKNHVSMCALANNSVVISDYKSGKVSRVNIPSGEVLWTCSLDKAEGITNYGEEYLIVACEGLSGVKMLNAHTGEVVTELLSSDIGSGLHTFDLHVAGSTLIVPTYGQTGPVLFYRLNV